MKLPPKLGMILLGVWLILFGVLTTSILIPAQFATGLSAKKGKSSRLAGFRLTLRSRSA